MRNLLFKDSLELERTDACTVKSPWLSCWQMQSKTLNERCQALPNVYMASYYGGESIEGVSK